MRPLRMDCTATVSICKEAATGASIQMRRRALVYHLKPTYTHTHQTDLHGAAEHEGETHDRSDKSHR